MSPFVQSPHPKSPEPFDTGNTFTNHWAAPSVLVSLEVIFGRFGPQTSRFLTFFWCDFCGRIPGFLKGSRSRIRSLSSAGEISAPDHEPKSESRPIINLARFMLWNSISAPKPPSCDPEPSNPESQTPVPKPHTPSHHVTPELHLLMQGPSTSTPAPEPQTPRKQTSRRAAGRCWRSGLG